SEGAYKLSMILVLIHNGMAMLIWPASFTMPNVLKAANDAKFTMCIALFSMFTFRILLSYIIGLKCGMGAIGVWIAMLVDWFFRSAAFALRYRGKRWLRHKVYTK
ncbi:MAG: MATE family efflux transporter, partial [Oscillospiraceae bacterium]|nr:MATE family efflux transporter [Oscillospiraceae bacterium]